MSRNTNHCRGKSEPPLFPPLWWRWLGGLAGGVMILFCILCVLVIWISYFDNDGGEPGATTIFGSIPLWPWFGLLIVAGGITCGFFRRVLLAVLVLTLLLFAWAFTVVMMSRAENRRQWEQQREDTAQELVVTPLPVPYHYA